MTKSFQFLFDFGGPNSYLAHKILPDICARTGAEAVYIPISLGGLFKLTNNQAPFMRYAETPAKRNYEMLEFDRFVKAHALPFKMNPRFPIKQPRCWAATAPRISCRELMGKRGFILNGSACALTTKHRLCAMRKRPQNAIMRCWNSTASSKRMHCRSK